MPIYEYACPKCGEFEFTQSIKDSPLARCPKCRSKVTKLISSAAFQLKGGGWYSDGYQKKSGNGSATAESSPSSDGGSKTESAAPAKAAAAAD
ncbi:MAG TPA: zinc ribbon domain-containing protein [Candidatus Limnocylindrales bacterium]|nr:zinc ribbon domain-containing protein [Candidatus Limnocylindrales bacterium]